MVQAYSHVPNLLELNYFVLTNDSITKIDNIKIERKNYISFHLLVKQIQLLYADSF